METDNQVRLDDAPKRYKVRSVDADGCIFNQHYCFEDPFAEDEVINKSPNRLIEANEVLIQADADEITTANYEATYYVVGSNRQDAYTDLGNFKYSDNEMCVGSFYPAIQGIAEAVAQRTDRPVFLNTMLLADLHSDKPLGFSFKQAIKHSYSQNTEGGVELERGSRAPYDYFDRTFPSFPSVKCPDNTKITLLYAQIHEHARMISALDPNAEIDFDFDDDTDKVLINLYNFFAQFPELIPNNVTLRLRKYAGPIEGGESITRIKPIVGTGHIDSNYAENIELIHGKLGETPTLNDDRIPLYDFTQFPISDFENSKRTNCSVNGSQNEHIIRCKPDESKILPSSRIAEITPTAPGLLYPASVALALRQDDNFVFQRIKDTGMKQKCNDALRKMRVMLEQDVLDARSKDPNIEDADIPAMRIIDETASMLGKIGKLSAEFTNQDLIDILQTYEDNCRGIAGHSKFLEVIGTFIVALLIATLVSMATMAIFDAAIGCDIADLFQHIYSGGKDLFSNSITEEAVRFIVSGSLGIVLGVAGGVGANYAYQVFSKSVKTLDQVKEVAKETRAGFWKKEAGEPVVGDAANATTAIIVV